jgi:hypothetical protein
MSKEEKVINRLIADVQHLNKLVQWQAAENRRLREALRPFAEKSTDCNSDYEWLVVKRDDCDKARAALGEGKE